MSKPGAGRGKGSMLLHVQRSVGLVPMGYLPIATPLNLSMVKMIASIDEEAHIALNGIMGFYMVDFGFI